jgi:hypothetical protein
MGGSVMALVLDIVVIVMLGVTIFYALRLSRHLDTFRSNRSDMEKLIRELSTQITRAQEGISTLDEISKERGDELRRLVAKAQGLSDELQLMTESGNSLAGRLEGLATKNRTIIDELSDATINRVYPGGKPPPTPYQPEERKVVRTPLGASASSSSSSASPFAIRDPDFEGYEKKSSLEERSPFEESGFSSQAERDLADALKKWTPQK